MQVLLHQQLLKRRWIISISICMKCTVSLKKKKKKNYSSLEWLFSSGKRQQQQEASIFLVRGSASLTASAPNTQARTYLSFDSCLPFLSLFPSAVAHPTNKRNPLFLEIPSTFETPDREKREEDSPRPEPNERKALVGKRKNPAVVQKTLASESRIGSWVSLSPWTAPRRRIEPRAAITHRKTKGRRITGGEATTRFESEIPSRAAPTSCRASSVGAISPPSGSPGTFATTYSS